MRTAARRLIGFENDPKLWLADGAIPLEDTLLSRQLGSDVSKYEKLLNDPHVRACLENRFQAVIGREVRVIPASDRRVDRRAAELVEQQLLGIRWAGKERQAGAPASVNFDAACLAWLSAILYGYKPIEVRWARDGSGWKIDSLRPVPSRRIKFDLVTNETPRSAQTHQDYAIKILTKSNPFRGEFLTQPYRILIHSWGSQSGNPYGSGIGSALWWFAEFKKDALKDWLVAVARAAALIRAIMPAGVDQNHPIYKEVQAFLEIFAPEHHLIAPDGVVLDFLESSRSDRAIQQEMCEYLDSQISRLIGGQTALVNQSQGGGSRARDEVAERVAMRLAKADADALSYGVLNTLAEWIVRLNMPSAKPPTIWRDFDDVENLTERADRDQKLSQATGLLLDPTYCEEIYGVKFAPKEENSDVSLRPVGRVENPDPALAGDSNQPISDQPNPALNALTFDALSIERLQQEQQRRREVWRSIQGAPYVRYIRIREAQNPRESHTALEGKVFPNDPEFWAKACPPSAFNCGHSLEPVGADYDGEITPLPNDEETLRHLNEWLGYDDANRSYFDLGE
jgi:phage gp29-like protein